MYTTKRMSDVFESLFSVHSNADIDFSGFVDDNSCILVVCKDIWMSDSISWRRSWLLQFWRTWSSQYLNKWRAVPTSWFLARWGVLKKGSRYCFCLVLTRVFLIKSFERSRNLDVESFTNYYCWSCRRLENWKFRYILIDPSSEKCWLGERRKRWSDCAGVDSWAAWLYQIYIVTVEKSNFGIWGDHGTDTFIRTCLAAL